jgi:predicted nicotinamide N-methyase
MHTQEDSESRVRCHSQKKSDDRLRARLLHRIARRYAVVTEPLRIGHLDLRFTRIREPDRVLDQIVAEEDRRERITGTRKDGDELHLPYWAELWDSSFGLGTFLAEHGTRASNVLDLGCGMGLSGLVAAALGARVTLVDLEAPALLFARVNTLPYDDRAHVRKLDWRRDRLDQRFDLILGADVLYERGQWEHLEPFWRAHVAPGGSVLLGEPGRQTGDMFPEWIVARGWALERFEQMVPTRGKPIRIFALRR